MNRLRPKHKKAQKGKPRQPHYLGLLAAAGLLTVGTVGPVMALPTVYNDDNPVIDATSQPDATAGAEIQAGTGVQWNADQVPVINGSLTYTGTNTVTVANDDGEAGSIIVDGTGITGTLNLNGHNVTVSGAVNGGSGLVIDGASGTLTAGSTVTGNITVASGASLEQAQTNTLEGTVKVTVTGTGTVQLGTVSSNTANVELYGSAATGAGPTQLTVASVTDGTVTAKSATIGQVSGGAVTLAGNGAIGDLKESTVIISGTGNTINNVTGTSPIDGTAGTADEVTITGIIGDPANLPTSLTIGGAKELTVAGGVGSTIQGGDGSNKTTVDIQGATKADFTNTKITGLVELKVASTVNGGNAVNVGQIGDGAIATAVTIEGNISGQGDIVGGTVGTTITIKAGANFTQAIGKAVSGTTTFNINNTPATATIGGQQDGAIIASTSNTGGATLVNAGNVVGVTSIQKGDDSKGNIIYQVYGAIGDSSGSTNFTVGAGVSVVVDKIQGAASLGANLVVGGQSGTASSTIYASTLNVTHSLTISENLTLNSVTGLNFNANADYVDSGTAAITLTTGSIVVAPGTTFEIDNYDSGQSFRMILFAAAGDLDAQLANLSHSIDNGLDSNGSLHFFDRSLATYNFIAKADLDATFGNTLNAALLAGNPLSPVLQNLNSPHTVEQFGFANRIWAMPHFSHQAIAADFAQGYGDLAINSYGFSLGVDHLIQNRHLVGFFANINQARLNGDHSKITGNGFDLGLYARLIFGPDLTLDLGLAHGWQSYEAEHQVIFAGNSQANHQLSADLQGRSLALAAELSKSFDLGHNLSLRPGLGYTYLGTWLDAYTEQSSLSPGDFWSLAQQVEKSAWHQHLARLGADLTWTGGRVAVSGRLYYLHNFGDIQPQATARLVNGQAGNTVFAITGAAQDANLLNLGLTVQATPLTRTQVALSYDALLGADSHGHSLNLSVSYNW